MSEPIMVRVTAVNTLLDADFPPDSLIDFIDWLKSKLEDIPQEYRASASLELDAEVDRDGYASPYQVIAYERPETEHEMAERIALEAQRAEDRRKLDLDILRDLKAKYPDAA